MAQISLVGKGWRGLNEVARQPCATPESMCLAKKLSRNSAVHISSPNENLSHNNVFPFNWYLTFIRRYPKM